MANPDKPKPAGGLITDLLPVLRKSNVLPERVYDEIRAKVLKGDLPGDPKQLAAHLLREGLLTEYQARRLLAGKSHGLSLGKYTILDRIGSGSMGRVYKAQHLLMGRTVALKIIAPEVASNPRVVSRFQREMKLVGRLDHPNVVRAYDADRMGETLFIVMEYVPGMSLGQRFRSQGTFPAVELIDYAAQAALGLGHAHSQGVVHRDVKPSNLLLTDDGLVKVLDLGLGVLMESDTHSTFATQDGIAVGTIDYMSPEQARGGDVDGRSDIYSLGCAMYHLISGRLPFPAESPIERLGRRINNQPEPLASFVRSLPPKFPEVLDRMLANRPEDRYQSADETASALWSTLPDGKKRKRRHAFSVTDSSVEAAPPQPQVIERKVEVEVEVMPNFPGWFQPVADFVLTSPNGGLATVIGLLLLTFAAGLLAGWLLLPRS